MEPDYQLIGQRLQESRKASGLTQQALADIMGVSVSYIKSTERGSKPSIKYLFVVANRCHVSFDWLLTGVQNETISTNSQQKNEVIFDPDTRDMIEAVKMMMSDSDPEMRTWAKVQFRRTFPDFFHALEEKKEHA